MGVPAKIRFKWDPDQLNDHLKEKTGHGLLEYASVFAHVVMEISIGKPFGTSVPDDPIETVKKKLKEARTLLNKLSALELWEEVDSLKEGIAFLKEVVRKERAGGRPVDKATVIMFFWARLAKRDGKVPYAMLRTLLRWFYERLPYGYTADISSIIKIEDWRKEGRRKEFKKRCTIKHETEKPVKSKITKSERAKLDKLLADPKIMDSFLAWRNRDRKPDWKDKDIRTIVAYLRAYVFKQTRKISARSVIFSANSIEVEADYKDGDGLKTVRWKRDFKTQEFTEVFLDPSEVRNFGSVVFSE